MAPTLFKWPEDEEMKRLTLDLPEDLHRAIKTDAAKSGQTMAQKLRALLSQHYEI